MRPEIEPTRPEDLDELGRFLAEGFGAPREAFAEDILRWKYFEPSGGDEPFPRSLVARAGGRIVAHAGLFFTTFRIAEEGVEAREVPTMHLADWLAAPGYPGVGFSLVRKSHHFTPTQYGLGGTEAARRVGRSGFYDPLPAVPVYRAVLRPGHRLRAGRSARALAGLARDLARGLRHRARRPEVAVEARPVAAFGPVVDLILDACPRPLVSTDRRPSRLNYHLKYPRPGINGWLLAADGRDLGFALLNVVPRGAVRHGKIVDCFLKTDDPAAWQSAFAALRRLLRDQGADVVEAIASTPWAAVALGAAGFYPAHALEAQIRDRGGLVPRSSPFHLSFLEADYAYTP